MNPQTSQFPNDLPLVPLREAVVFPKLVVPLGVGREKSVAAINAAMNEEKHYIVLAAQKDAEVDDVAPEQIYSVGTVAEIVRLLRIPDGSAQIIVQGIHRVRITNYLPEQRFFRVNYEVIPDEIGNPVEREALLRSVRGLFEKYVDNGGPRRPRHRRAPPNTGGAHDPRRLLPPGPPPAPAEPPAPLPGPHAGGRPPLPPAL